MKFAYYPAGTIIGKSNRLIDGTNILDPVYYELFISKEVTVFTPSVCKKCWK